MMIAAAKAIADVVAEDRLNPSYIVPSVFDASVAPAVAAAIRDVSGTANRTQAMHTG
jgi:malate dehydrogenase (oxaloacetate-decarboxylating)